MRFSSFYVSAGTDKNEYDHFVPAPFLRKNFELDFVPEAGEITISGLGFYRLFINGTEITKGLLAPGISNLNDIVYHDRYELGRELLRKGRNTIGILLGNGFLNNPCGNVWDFEQLTFRDAPKVAFFLSCRGAGEVKSDEIRTVCFETEAGLDMKWHASPLYFDDLRSGERYDARLEIPDWAAPDFDDSGWEPVVRALCPDGEKKLCTADPVRKFEELHPVSIKWGKSAPFHVYEAVKDTALQEPEVPKEGWIYDFGLDRAGILKIRVRGTEGQRIDLQTAECLDEEGRLNYDNLNFYPDGYAQHDVYICSGKGTEEHELSFTYHGCRYVMVSGITEEQAKEDLLTFVVIHSDVEPRAEFSCSDETANTLFQMARGSDLSNLVWIPTDCPHREKNGWMGDAALSSEHFLLEYDCGRTLRAWLDNIRAAQGENGSLPVMVPTGAWGRDSGPSWDMALTVIPWDIMRFTGDRAVLEENASAVLKYLRFLARHRKEDGTVELYLGDWCPVTSVKATVNFTDSVSAFHIASTAVKIFRELGIPAPLREAEELAASLREAIRRKFMMRRFEEAGQALSVAGDADGCFTGIVDTGSQTSQAMAIHYGILHEEEIGPAFDRLLERIHADGDFIDVGILGARVLFRVLAEHGEQDLAFRMMTRREWPSYGHFIEQERTAIPEQFHPDGHRPDSLNHHMFADISAFMIEEIAGICYNPNGTAPGTARIAPKFIGALDRAEASFRAPEGEISVRWERRHPENSEAGAAGMPEICLTIRHPAALKIEICVPEGTEVREITE